MRPRLVMGVVTCMLCVILTAPIEARTVEADSTWSFVVLGHVRGYGRGLHPRLAEALRDVARHHPRLLVLPGDLVLGDLNTIPRRRDVVLREWEELDSALATTGVPWIQVPGNHDINDLITRDIYRERYEIPPRSLTVRDARFLLLRSGWVPEDGDTAQGKATRGVPIDSAQIAWLRTELARPGPYRYTFVVLHHLLWWEADGSAWWQEVHPLLRDAGVRAVFSGDHGPFKFSHRQRDGVDYYQTSIGGDPSVGILRALESSRVLAAQFDNYLVVSLNPDSVSISAEVTGAVTSGHFTPEQWEEAYQWRPESLPLSTRLWNAVNSPARLAAAGMLLLIGVATGFGLGRRRRS